MAVAFLHELNVPFFKVGSGDTNNFPYLEKTAKKGEAACKPSRHGRSSAFRVLLCGRIKSGRQF